MQNVDDYQKYAIVYAGDRNDDDDNHIGLWPSPGGNHYIMEEKDVYVLNWFSNIGTHCHELGHIAWALDDLYGYGGTQEDPRGIGTYCLMASGSSGWLCAGGEARPTLMCCWTKAVIGWIDPDIVTATQESTCISNVEENDKAFVYFLSTPNQGDWYQGEYFIIENRQPIGFDGDMKNGSYQNGGLLIYHYNESSMFPNHAYIDLEEADGSNHLDVPDGGYSSVADFFPGATNNRAFTPYTSPNSNRASGQPSYFAVKNMSDGGSNMLADFLKDYCEIKGDANGDEVINVLDALFAVNIILGVEIPDFAEQCRANVCEDATIDVIDVLSIANLILGLDLSNSCILIDDFAVMTPAIDSLGNLQIWAENLSISIAAFQGNARIPPTMSPVSIQPVGRGTSLDLDSCAYSDSVLSVLYDADFSVCLDSIPPGNGPILKYVFMGTGTPWLENVVLSTLNGEQLTVVINYQPNTPSNPSPSDGATNQLNNVDLSWSGGDPDSGNTVTHKVYFGSTNPPPLVASNYASTTYEPGTLQYGQHYYWKIVAYDNHQVPTYGPEGWDFTTGAALCDTPSISSISPTSGQVDVVVTINGSNFGSSQGSSYVMFNGAQATQYTLWGTTQIKCKVPACAIKGNVTVVTCATSNGKLFSVTPYISNVSPTSGGEGTTVTVNGTGFGSSRGSSYVKFNTTQATDYTSWGCGQIICTVPTGATDGNVKVTTAGGTSNGISFDVTCSPPPVPTGLTGTFVPGEPASHPQLTWNASSGATSYTVYKSLDLGPYDSLASPEDTFYVDEGFCSGGGLVDMARYKVSALNGSCESAMTSTYKQFRGYQCAQSKLVAEAPEGYLLFQNYPNPFNPETEIAFGLAEPSYVRLVVYNILGQEMRVLIDEFMDGGYHTLRWDSRNEEGDTVPAGVYLYRLETSQFADTKRMILLK